MEPMPASKFSSSLWKAGETPQGRNAMVALACLISGGLSTWLGGPKGGSILLWLPMGVGLGAVLRWGSATWPGVAAGAFGAYLLAGASVLTAMTGALGNSLGIVGTCHLLRRLPGFRSDLAGIRDILYLLYTAMPTTAAVSATAELAAQAAGGTGFAQGPLTFWWLSWLRHALGILSVTPLLLTWFPPVAWRSFKENRREVLTLLVILCLMGAVVFCRRSSVQTGGYSVAYVVFVPAIWAALRFGPAGTSLVVLLVALWSAFGTARQAGPFAVDPPSDVALLWGVFNGVFALSSLILASVMAERMSGERALETSEARYRHLLSHAPIGIWEEDFSALVRWLNELRAAGVTDLKAHLDSHPEAASLAAAMVRVTDVNEVSLKMFETDRPTQLTGELGRLFSPEARGAFLEEVMTIWDGKARHTGEVRGQTLKGRRLDYLVHWDANTESGQPDWSHVIVAIMDITEQSRLREEFRQAQKMEAIGRMAGGIAHDFNNLIMTIQGYSSMLLADATASASSRDELEQIKRAAERAAALTRQLLAFGRKQVMKPSVLALNTVVLDMNKMLRRLIGEHIELRQSLAEDLGWIRADTGQVEQVIVNLAINARDAMPKGGVLTIATANLNLMASRPTQTGHLPAKQYVTLKVTDTGCGMSPATKAHLFEPFFTTKAAGLGTGLGLSTVYGIVKQSGGDIDVESVEGRGTSLEIFLPRVEKPQGRDDRGRVIDLLPRGSESILVVEDEDSVREWLCKCLRTHGYAVLEASSGPQALQIAERVGKIELLVTDIVMPGMEAMSWPSGSPRRAPACRFSSFPAIPIPPRCTMIHGPKERPFCPSPLRPPICCSRFAKRWTDLPRSTFLKSEPRAVDTVVSHRPGGPMRMKLEPPKWPLRTRW
jgi:signal transduction histidine kinase/integral membrane sensor domain MASE1